MTIWLVCDRFVTDCDILYDPNYMTPLLSNYKKRKVKDTSSSPNLRGTLLSSFCSSKIKDNSVLGLAQPNSYTIVPF